MGQFPECFPEKFETDILPQGAKKENKSVYRVIKYGTINRDSFIGTYEEIQRGLIPRKKRMNLDDPGLYSTSCNIEYSEAQYAMNIFMRHHPKVFIAKGQTEGSCGPCQLTSEREERNDTHVDWWIYQEAEPQNYFNEVAENE
ncbi:MAG: hypothetical protein HFH93_10290 [Lachnospiraceae bacterium]|nr:hypothetical protein [Lachnospiraceae bacterium]